MRIAQSQTTSLPNDAVDAVSLLVFNGRSGYGGETLCETQTDENSYSGQHPLPLATTIPRAEGLGWWPGTALHGLATPVLTGLCPGLLRVHICLQSCVSRTLLAITCPATVINIY